MIQDAPVRLLRDRHSRQRWSWTWTLGSPKDGLAVLHRAGRLPPLSRYVPVRRLDEQFEGYTR